MRHAEQLSRTETIAEMIHKYKHKLGRSKVCGECRELAKRIIEALHD